MISGDWIEKNFGFKPKKKSNVMICTHESLNCYIWSSYAHSR